MTQPVLIDKATESVVVATPDPLALRELLPRSKTLPHPTYTFATQHTLESTKVLRNMAALECIYGFSTAWFLLAPPEYYGLGLGAVGLAIKTVCVQIITVNVYLWLASRFIPLKFWRNVAHQVWSLAVLLLLAFGCRQLTLYLGIGDVVSLSTITRANESRSYLIYEDLVKLLIKEAKQLYIEDDGLEVSLKNNVFAIDATTIDLCLSTFYWATFRSTKGGIKLHTQLDLKTAIPEFICQDLIV